VTAALSAWLAAEFGVAAVPAHDRPPAFFARLAPAARRSALARVGSAAGVFDARDPFWRGSADLGAACCADGAAEERPRVVVSATSWSPDEDFMILVDALSAYEAAGAGPRLLVVVTGKGPLRDAFVAAIAARKLKRVLARTAWLAAADYAARLRRRRKAGTSKSSLGRERFAIICSKGSIHTSRTCREMITRSKMSRSERELTERGASKVEKKVTGFFKTRRSSGPRTSACACTRRRPASTSP